jgi:SAM-dependent methyltransferase
MRRILARARLTDVKDKRTAIVEAGYDAMADRYLGWASRIEADPRERMLDEFAGRLRPGTHVLDLGCGAGVPSTRLLAGQFKVTGVDISGQQIARARRSVPHATFVHADMAVVEFRPSSFGGVTALYAVSHLPRELHGRLFERVARWLIPGGLFLATLGATDSPDWIGEWLDQPMFFSSFAADTYRGLLTSTGFELMIDEVLDTNEPEGPVPFLWVLGRRP